MLKDVNLMQSQFSGVRRLQHTNATCNILSIGLYYNTILTKRLSHGHMNHVRSKFAWLDIILDSTEMILILKLPLLVYESSLRLAKINIHTRT